MDDSAHRHNQLFRFVPVVSLYDDIPVGTYVSRLVACISIKVRLAFVSNFGSNEGELYAASIFSSLDSIEDY